MVGWLVAAPEVMMKATALLVGGMLLCLFIPALLAQDEPEVFIFQNIEDEPLGKVMNQLALMGGLEVEVEQGLRDKKITLVLDVPLEEALEKIAAAAGAHLVKTGPKAYAIRSKPAPEGGSGEAAGTEEKREPDWIRPLRKRLEKTEVSFLWTGKPLPEILTWLSKKSGVCIRLDPRVLNERSKESLAIHIAEYDDNLNSSPITASAARALGMALSYPGLDLAQVFRFGGIYVSTREHIRAIPPVTVLPADADSELRRKILSAVVTVKLSGATLAKAVEKIAKAAGVKVGFDRKFRRAFRAERIDLDVEKMPLLDALEFVLAPRGLVLETGEKGLIVRRAPE